MTEKDIAKIEIGQTTKPCVQQNPVTEFEKTLPYLSGDQLERTIRFATASEGFIILSYLRVQLKIQQHVDNFGINCKFHSQPRKEKQLCTTYVAA